MRCHEICPLANRDHRIAELCGFLSGIELEVEGESIVVCLMRNSHHPDILNWQIGAECEPGSECRLKKRIDLLDKTHFTGINVGPVVCTAMGRKNVFMALTLPLEEEV